MEKLNYALSSLNLLLVQNKAISRLSLGPGTRYHSLCCVLFTTNKNNNWEISEWFCERSLWEWEQLFGRVITIMTGNSFAALDDPSSVEQHIGPITNTAVRGWHLCLSVCERCWFLFSCRFQKCPPFWNQWDIQQHFERAGLNPLQELLHTVRLWTQIPHTVDC